MNASSVSPKMRNIDFTNLNHMLSRLVANMNLGKLKSFSGSNSRQGRFRGGRLKSLRKDGDSFVIRIDLLRFS